MSAYQNFLNFFSLHNKERLDGLSEAYFAAMNKAERDMAFSYLLKLVEAGGTDESVNGLFMADYGRAVKSVKDLLAAGELTGEAQIAAAWNLSQTQSSDELFPIFARLMCDPDRYVREKAVCFVPDDVDPGLLEASLKSMIRTEVEQLPRIHAVNKLLKYYGISKDSVGVKEFQEIYMGLHSGNLNEIERSFKKMEILRKSRNTSGDGAE